MNESIKAAAAILGRKGGRATSPSKAQAARINGMKGGRLPIGGWIKLDGDRALGAIVASNTEWGGTVLIVKGRTPADSYAYRITRHEALKKWREVAADTRAVLPPGFKECQWKATTIASILKHL